MVFSAASRQLHSSKTGLKEKKDAAIDEDMQDKELMLLNISTV